MVQILPTLVPPFKLLANFEMDLLKASEFCEFVGSPMIGLALGRCEMSAHCSLCNFSA